MFGKQECTLTTHCKGYELQVITYHHFLHLSGDDVPVAAVYVLSFIKQWRFFK